MTSYQGILSVDKIRPIQYVYVDSLQPVQAVSILDAG
jgi:hypothetical protein